jgi:hypothetical protein
LRFPYINEKKLLHAHVAQSVERVLGKDKVTGSNPVVSSNGGVAQLARAHGSYPWSPGFKSLRRYHVFRLPAVLPE